MAAKQSKIDIIAFGFDRITHDFDKASIESTEFTIRHVGYTSEESLADADAVMIPSDIFETPKTSQDIYGHTSTWWTPDTSQLAEREKELYRLLDQKGWACFFLAKLRNGTQSDPNNGDLVRRIVNRTFSGTNVHDPYPHLNSKADEFRKFFEDFGIARTSLYHYSSSAALRLLATSDRNRDTFAAELSGQKFFLPLKPLNRKGELNDILTTAAEAIISYKKRNDLYLPKWVEAIQFQSEQHAAEEIDQMKQRLEEVALSVAKWQRYRGVLTSSGRLLNEIAVEILRDFFGLNLNSKEAYIEDAMICSASGEREYVVEIKGVSAGIKREHINQLDSHRERLGLNDQIPGLLLINDFADVAGLEARKSKPIDSQHLEHAKRLNVRILRTTTLIEFMQLVESQANRGEALMTALAQATPVVTLPS